MRSFRPITRFPAYPLGSIVVAPRKLRSAPDVFNFRALRRHVTGSIKERKKDDGVPPERGHVTAPRNLKNAVNLEDYGVFAVNEDDFRLALLPDDMQNASDFPTAGSPTYRALDNRKLLDWKGWIPRRPRTARQAGISFPGPWNERALGGRTRRIGP